jgi:hypothetical protein
MYNQPFVMYNQPTYLPVQVAFYWHCDLWSQGGHLPCGGKANPEYLSDVGRRITHNKLPVL